ncbi:hypothetical protein [Methylobacterium sp. Leaf89]|uniref:hypothetical protein n=1 Tax=Methylobacterium sp. Leaf89 TaxID=1736245 RepID=UPI0007014748|nr:hypothetical protein [Methylobacterium sp. Leaf89]KQO71079.1 hypothetical protein ASF18_00900 [Methylobacterium sp. Leaf89]
MLVELLHLLVTPVPFAHRRRGHLRESVLLMSRGRRCRSAWAPHLAAARAAILDACDGLPQRRVAVVLGSGLLQDVPLADLAARFARVDLVDAVHLWPARLRARAHPNVRLVTADLALRTDRTDRPDPLAALCGGADVDFVVSANLLSQLPILPLDRPGFVPPDLGNRIVRAHLDGLAGLRARVCLVTDVEQIEEDRTGRVTERLDLLHGVRLGTPDRRWTWDLAPFGEATPHRRLIHRVEAFLDWRSP